MLGLRSPRASCSRSQPQLIPRHRAPIWVLSISVRGRPRRGCGPGRGQRYRAGGVRVPSVPECARRGAPRRRWGSREFFDQRRGGIAGQTPPGSRPRIFIRWLADSARALALGPRRPSAAPMSALTARPVWLQVRCAARRAPADWPAGHRVPRAGGPVRAADARGGRAARCVEVFDAAQEARAVWPGSVKSESGSRGKQFSAVDLGRARGHVQPQQQHVVGEVAAPRTPTPLMAATGSARSGRRRGPCRHVARRHATGEWRRPLVRSVKVLAPTTMRCGVSPRSRRRALRVRAPDVGPFVGNRVRGSRTCQSRLRTDCWCARSRAVRRRTVSSSSTWRR